MLSLQLKIHRDGSSKDRRIFIGGNIIVTVVSIDGNKLVLGFEAPADVPVLREALLTLEQVQDIEAAARHR